MSIFPIGTRSPHKSLMGRETITWGSSSMRLSRWDRILKRKSISSRRAWKELHGSGVSRLVASHPSRISPLTFSTSTPISLERSQPSPIFRTQLNALKRAFKPLSVDLGRKTEFPHPNLKLSRCWSKILERCFDLLSAQSVPILIFMTEPLNSRSRER